MNRCEFCGKEFIKKEFEFLGMKKIIEVAQCNCFEEHEQAEKIKKISEMRKAKIEKIFDNSMMTPFFRKKRFENVSENEIIKKCRIYAENFSKKVSTGISFIGDVGTGKTTGLACICNELMERGYLCLFITFSELLNKFSDYAYNNAGNITPLLNDLCKFNLIIFDDMFRHIETEKKREYSFLIIDKLMNYEIPICYTSNFETFEKYQKVKEWDAIFDRLKTMTETQIITGKSLRG